MVEGIRNIGYENITSLVQTGNSKPIKTANVDNANKAENKNETQITQDNSKATVADDKTVYSVKTESKADAEKKQDLSEKKTKVTVGSMGTDATYSYNKDIDRFTITITDRDTKEVLKEIPSEETQKMLKRLHTVNGMYLDTEA